MSVWNILWGSSLVPSSASQKEQLFSFYFTVSRSKLHIIRSFCNPRCSNRVSKYCIWYGKGNPTADTLAISSNHDHLNTLKEALAHGAAHMYTGTCSHRQETAFVWLFLFFRSSSAWMSIPNSVFTFPGKIPSRAQDPVETHRVRVAVNTFPPNKAEFKKQPRKLGS